MRTKTDEAKILAKKLIEIKVDSYEDYNHADFFEGFKFLISNENYLHNQIPEKLEALKDGVADKMQIAIIIGEGHFLSMLPIYAGKIDLVIFYDINPIFLAHQKILVESMRASRDITEFYEIYHCEFKKQFGEDKVKPNLEGLRLRDLAGVGEMSFLHSEERYALCKEKLEQIETAYFCASLLSLEQVQMLTECLGASEFPCSIELLNISNLREYCTEDLEKNQLQSNVNLLTRFNRSEEEDNPIILYSGLYKGELMETYATMGGCSIYVAQLTQNAAIEQMEIVQHPSLQYDPFDMGLSPDETFERIARLTNLFLHRDKPGTGLPSDLHEPGCPIS